MKKYIEKFSEQEILDMINEDFTRLSAALWSYRNNNRNEPKSLSYDHAPNGLDQSVGKVIYNLRLLESILNNRHKYSVVDIAQAVKRWEDHTESFNEEAQP